ncbi:serine hydrolase [Microbacterium sp. NPDC019599]|uniref:serine hydrolase n=1 Tax=Microbacterium sp. NPDC019599 TaxID=3154690 RepID=UPI0033DCB26A
MGGIGGRDRLGGGIGGFREGIGDGLRQGVGDGVRDGLREDAVDDILGVRRRVDDGIRDGIVEGIRDQLHPRWAAAHGLDADAYARRFDELVGQGYRLTDVSGWWDGTHRFAGIWDTSAGPAWQARHALPIGLYQETFDALAAEGLRPVRLAFYGTPNGVHVAGLWQGGPSPAWAARHDLDKDAFQAEFNRLAGEGYRLVDVSGYEDGGQARFAGVWELSAGGGWAARHGVSRDDYQAAFRELTGQGLLLRKATAFTVGGAVLYSGIWEERPVPAQSARHGVPAADWQRIFDDHFYQAYRPVQVDGYATPTGVQFAGAFENTEYAWSELERADQLIDAFISAYSVPGLSMAISSGGRLVYARARGWADRDAKTPLEVRHRMRVASVSKPVTAAAVLRLVHDGRLALSDAILGSAGRLGTTYGALSYSAAQLSITVDHLLTHLSGYDNSGGDPMFLELARDHASLIGWVLDNRAPAKTPGTDYTYLNFGYCLLGRVIEHVTGQTYQDYVRSAILAPAGVSAMSIAGDTAADRAADEVVYYGQGGEDPYDMKVARMDAHGGWLANAPDLLCFLRAVDGRDGGDLLTAAEITTMTTGTTVRPGYARGWAVDGAGNWDHNGALPGTLSLLRRRADGTGHAALINTRQGGAMQQPMLDAFYAMVDDVQSALGTLADVDLF